MAGDEGMDHAFDMAWAEMRMDALPPTGSAGFAWRWRWVYVGFGMFLFAWGVYAFFDVGVIALTWCVLGFMFVTRPTDMRGAYNDGARMATRTMVTIMFRRRRDDPT